MKYLYEITESETQVFPKGEKFWSEQKIHNKTEEETELADKDCKPFWIKCIEEKSE